MRRIAALLVACAGFLDAGSIDGFDRAGLGQSMFLLAPGGQDYVGANSYDNDGKDLPWETEPHSA
jgi:hypothetical protein